MNHWIRSCFFLLPILLVPAYADSVLDENNYWQCITRDATSKEWLGRNFYQKAALNISFADCKKQSVAPSSCRATKVDCEQFIQGVSMRPMWRCTAFDRMALRWRSNYYSQRDDAALGAKAYCRQKSPVPDTCYINFITCLNINEF